MCSGQPGEVYDNLAAADTALHSTSTISSESFLVESADRGHNVLTAEALREWHAASQAVRGDAGHSEHLVDRFDTEANATIPAVFSIADAVDQFLPGGIASASNDEIVGAIASVLDPAAPTAFLQFTLSESSERTEVGGSFVWSSPAFMTTVTFDVNGFDSNSDRELWLREVQEDFRTEAVFTDSIGVGIDGDTAFEEAAQQSAPFIFLAVGLITLLVAAVHRSFWSAAVVGAGMAATTLAYYGTAAFLGLKMGSLLRPSSC